MRSERSKGYGEIFRIWKKNAARKYNKFQVFEGYFLKPKYIMLTLVKYSSQMLGAVAPRQNTYLAWVRGPGLNAQRWGGGGEDPSPIRCQPLTESKELRRKQYKFKISSMIPANVGKHAHKGL